MARPKSQEPPAPVGQGRGSLRRDLVYERIRDRVLAGALPFDAKLPSTRAYACELGVARGTVEEAYARLAAEGFVVALGAAGTRVRWQGKVGGEAGSDAVSVPLDSDVFAYGRGLPLGLGVPALAEFPFDTWSRALARAARATTRRELVAADGAGEGALRVALSRHVALSRGVRCEPAQVAITSGYQAALVLAALATVGPGGTAYVEDPGYPKARDALAALGLRVECAAVDAEGFSVADLGDGPSALVAITPSHQMPTGVRLSEPRRAALLDWARRSPGRWLLEDDYDGDFHFRESPLPALFAADRHGRTLYAGTFSKALFPGVRVGFLVAPVALAPAVRRLCALVSPSPSAVVQRALAELISTGQLARHLTKMRKLYERRRAAVLGALRATLGPNMAVDEGSGGLHLVVRWTGGSDDRAVVARAAALGLGGRALSMYRVAPSPLQGVLVGFANVPERSAKTAISKLCAALENR